MTHTKECLDNAFVLYHSEMGGEAQCTCEMWTHREHEVTFADDVRCVVMPCCGFTFDADHTDRDGDTWTCPICDDDRSCGLGTWSVSDARHDRRLFG
jgi:hypothetical protein